MVGRAKPRVFPFEELRVSGSLERRHRRTSSLSSRWIGLQSITHASSTLSVGCSHLALSIHGLARRLTVSLELRGLRCASRQQQVNTARASHALHLASRVRSENACPRTPAPRTAQASTGCPPVRFCGSTTFTVKGSDQHQAYRTWLCCAHRLSQPLDASFRLKPLRPCFIPVTPLSFCLQRIPPSDSRHASRRALPLMPLRNDS